MCELFGMSARHPASVNDSLALLRPRGGEIGPHADGWGVAFYDGRAARVFKEPTPAAESRCLAFIAEYDFQSTTVIGHIRRANPPEIGRASANTHPFERELGGRSWVFAHNSKLPGIGEEPGPTRFLPIGKTDSEFAFCLLLDAIADGDRGAAAGGADNGLIDVLAGPVGRIARFGEFNFLLSDGGRVLAHVHTRLHLLRRTCVCDGQSQSVVLLATSPLSDEPWTALDPGNLYLFADGDEIARLSVSAPPPAHSTDVMKTAEIAT